MKLRVKALIERKRGRLGAVAFNSFALIREIVRLVALGPKISLFELRNAADERVVIRGVIDIASSQTRVGQKVRICDLKAQRAVAVFSWLTTSVQVRLRVHLSPRVPL